MQAAMAGNMPSKEIDDFIIMALNEKKAREGGDVKWMDDMKDAYATAFTNPSK
jgi:hypothetical protein